MQLSEQELINKIQALGFEVAAASYLDEIQAKRGNYTSRYWRLPSQNYRLQRTPFFKNDENDYVHFTSTIAIESILKSEVFRMYNLSHMEDKFEMVHVREKLKFQDFIEFEKGQIFCLSMCSAKVIRDKMKEHLLWKLHGYDGEGVMLRMRFENEIAHWYNYHLTKVFYNYKIADPVLQLNKITKRERLDPKIGCFLKLPIYKFESESRLLFDNRVNHQVISTDAKGNIIYPIVHQDPSDPTNQSLYTEMPIWNFNKSNESLYHAPNAEGMDYKIPKISITELVFGYNCAVDKIAQIKAMASSLDSSIKLSVTKLKQYY